MSNDRRIIGLAAIAAAAAVVAAIVQWRDVETPQVAHRASPDIMQGLPPTAFGRPLDQPAPAMAEQNLQPDDSGQPGSSVRGRVSRLYYRAQDNIFVAAEYTLAHQRLLQNLYVEIEFPDRLKNGAQSMLGRAVDEYADARVGDIVSLRLAHRHDPKNFPVRETTKVTGLIAGRDTELARAYERRIVARKSGGAVYAAQPQPTLIQALGGGDAAK
ncbi:MAG: hypothetical protein EXR31_01690 [Betaproteobacteria bacterium]|nr:hypothetical protein [Betaproteobacteria bacterium]